LPPPSDTSVIGKLYGAVLGDAQDTAAQQKKVTYGTEKHPFEVYIPGWQDIIHVKRPPKISADQVRAFYAAKHRNNLDYARQRMTDDQLQELQHRDLMIRAMQASPAPDWQQKVTKILVALDTAQDVLFTAEAATLPLALTAPELAGPILGVERILRTALEGVTAATAVLTPVGAALATLGTLKSLSAFQRKGGAARKRNAVNSLRTRLSQILDISDEARKFIQLVKSPGGAILAAQSAEQFTGYGTTIGQLFISADNAIWGAVKAAQGQHVKVTYDPSASPARKAFAGALNTVYGWLDGQILSPEDHIQLQVAHLYNLQLMQQEYAVSTHYARLFDLVDNPMPHTNVWNEATQAMMAHYGIAPATPQHWDTLTSGQNPTMRRLNDLGPAAFSRVAGELNQKIDRHGIGNFVQALATQMRDTSIAHITGIQKPAKEHWNELDSITLAMAEHGPWTQPLEPIVTLMALDSLHLWWLAARNTLTDPRTGQLATPRSYLTVQRGFQQAFIPEVVNCGACPKFWQHAGHVGLSLKPSSSVKAFRRQHPKFKRPALTVSRRADGAAATVIPPDVESGLDQMLDEQIEAALLSGQLVDLLTANTYSRPGYARAGQDVFTPLDPVPGNTVTPVHPADGTIPVSADDLVMTVYLNDHNFGLYGATHKGGAAEGGHANDPVLSLAYGTRYAPQRNLHPDAVITAIDATLSFVGGVGLLTRLLSQPDPVPVVWHPAYQPEPYLIVQWHFKANGQQYIRRPAEEQLWGGGFTHITQAIPITIPSLELTGQFGFVQMAGEAHPQYVWTGRSLHRPDQHHRRRHTHRI
jgi:hypothetical protein